MSGILRKIKHTHAHDKLQLAKLGVRSSHTASELIVMSLSVQKLALLVKLFKKNVYSELSLYYIYVSFGLRIIKNRFLSSSVIQPRRNVCAYH